MMLDYVLLCYESIDVLLICLNSLIGLLFVPGSIAREQTSEVIVKKSWLGFILSCGCLLYNSILNEGWRKFVMKELLIDLGKVYLNDL